MEAFLKEIEGLKIVPKKMLKKGGRGSYKGTGRGDSLDFYGHRRYVAGDDIRKIDWLAYTRTEELYVKEFTEEKELHVNVVLDNSASMDYGDPNKWKMARTLALGLSYLTLKQKDSLSFYTINDDLICIQQYMRGKENFFNLLQLMENAPCRGTTVITKLMQLETGRSGITFVISDLLEKNWSEILDYLNVYGQEIVIIHSLAPSELTPNLAEELKLIDKETGKIRRIHFNSTVRASYMKKIREFIAQNREICTSREAQYVLAVTDMLPVTILARAVGGI